MSGRRTGLCALGVVNLPQQSSPNYQVPQVTADLRVYWPRNARPEDLIKAIEWACEDFQKQLIGRMLG